MSNLLNIGKTGLDASKKSLEVTGHNLANVNTEGYSRQRVEQSTNVPIAKSGMVQGTGVRVKNIRRVHDQFIENRLRNALSDKHFYENRSDQLSQVENVFNEVDGEGLNQIVNKFFNSFRELANQPENETIRSLVRDNARLVVKDFRRIRQTLDNVARNIDNKIINEVTNVNKNLEKISRLNKEIASLEAANGETGDLRDQRDLAVRQLSEIFDVHTYHDERGQFIVVAENVGTLVTGAEIQYLKTGSVSKEESTNNMPGSIEIFYKDRSTSPISGRFQNGVFQSIYQVRNEDIRDLQDTIDRVAYDLANMVNAVHRKGYANRAIDESARGPASFDAKGALTDINFFEEPVEIENASLHLDLSFEVKEDLSNIVTAYAPNSPGDNRIAIGISKIQDERFMQDGTATIEEFYLKTIGNIGLESGKATFDAEQSEGILAQSKNLRERLVGVSIDEEAANLVKFQHAYEASAKVMQTANEMFDTVLSIKR